MYVTEDEEGVHKFGDRDQVIEYVKMRKEVMGERLENGDLTPDEYKEHIKTLNGFFYI
jgi:uncharacterized membrane protein